MQDILFEDVTVRSGTGVSRPGVSPICVMPGRKVEDRLKISFIGSPLRTLGDILDMRLRLRLFSGECVKSRE